MSFEWIEEILDESIDTLAIPTEWLIALNPQPQDLDSRRSRVFGSKIRSELIGVQPFRPDFGTISKDPAALRRRNAN